MKELGNRHLNFMDCGVIIEDEVTRKEEGTPEESERARQSGTGDVTDLPKGTDI